jgi:hypothetical protein
MRLQSIETFNQTSKPVGGHCPFSTEKLKLIAPQENREVIADQVVLLASIPALRQD